MNRIRSGLFFLLLLGFSLVYGVDKGTDLSGTWKFIPWNDSRPSLSFMTAAPNTYTVETVTLPETKKLLRSGWYETTFPVPAVSKQESEYLAMELTIGQVVGNYQVYVNGHPVGVLKGYGITSKGRPQSFVLYPPVLKFGAENRLSIFVEGYGGGKGIGVIGPVLALSPLGDYALRKLQSQFENTVSDYLGKIPGADDNKSKPAKAWRKIQDLIRDSREALNQRQWNKSAAIIKNLEEQLPKVMADSNLYWKKRLTPGQSDIKIDSGYTPARPSFGILGRLYEDSLLLVDSNPSGFTLPYGPRAPYTVQYQGITPENITLSRMNWVTKTMVIEGTRDNKPVSYELTHSAVFPGVMLKVNDTEFSFTLTNASSTGPDRLGVVGKLKGSRAVPLYNTDGLLIPGILTDPDRGVAQLDRNWILFWNAGDPDPRPLQVIFEYPPSEILFKTNAAGQTVIKFKAMGPKANKREMLGRIVFMYPFGIDSPVKNGYSLRGESLPSPVVEACNMWGYSAMNFPIDLREYYKVDEAKGVVHILDQYEYQVLEDGFNRGRMTLAPIPPVLSQALIHGYPVKVSAQNVQSFSTTVQYGRVLPGLNMPLYTKFGEYGCFIGPTRLEYTLPLPSLEEQKITKPEAIDPWLAQLINESVTDLGYPTGPTGIDRVYKGNTQAWMAWDFLDKSNQDRLMKSSQTAGRQALHEDVWTVDVEPFTGSEYYWTYFLEGPYYGVYDVDWGNGLTLYGLQKEASIRNDWAYIHSNWPQIKKVYQWFPLADSWIWMSSVNADHGHGTGSGDCLCAAYAGSLAMARMAGKESDEAARNEALYIAAKTAVPVLSRFWLKDYADNRGMLSPGAYPIGYFEDEGVLTVSSTDDPWYMTSMISGNGVEPEVFDLYLKYAPDSLKSYEKDFDRFYPHWYDGQYKYNRKFTYPDNSGYTTLPHIYSRYRLGYPREQIMEYLRKASTTRKMWWVAPNVLSEIAADAKPQPILEPTESKGDLL